MATFYLDPVAGNDASNGTSWATAWKTLTLGATAARIAPGDTIRLVKSPDVVTTNRTATWTSSVDTLTTMSATSVTATTPINVTVAAHGLTTGDHVYITASTPLAYGIWKVTVTGANTFSLQGSSGTTAVTFGTVVKINSNVVELDQPVAQVIDNCDVLWTVAKGTCTLEQGLFRQGGAAIRCNMPATGNTANTLYHYKTLAAPLDLSAYQQINFYVGSDNTFAANTYRLCLCSDTAGTEIVHEVPIPAQTFTASSPVLLIPVLHDLGNPLSSSIQSVALYSGSAVPANSHRVYIDHIIATKAPSDPDCLTFSTLISPNQADWYCIGSIEGTKIKLEPNLTKAANVSGRGYGGNSGTFPLYKRETVKLPQIASTSISHMQLNDSGTPTAKIRLEGGWDKTTTTRNGHTVLDGVYNWGYGVSLLTHGHWDISGLSLVRFSNAVFGTTGNHSHTIQLGFASGINGQLSVNGIGCRVSVDSVVSAQSGSAVNGTNSEVVIGRVISAGDTATSGTGFVIVGTSNRAKVSEIYNCVVGFNSNGGRKNIAELGLIKNCIQEGFRAQLTTDCTIRGGTMVNVGTQDIFIGTTTEVAFRNATFNTVVFTDYQDCRVFSENHGGVVGDHRLYTDGMQVKTVQPAFATRPGGWVWQATPLTAATRLAHNPVDMRLGRIAVAANVPVTATIQVRKSSTDLSTLGFRLVCRGAQVAGVPNDVIVEATGAVDTWEPCTITFTPTENGVVELSALIHGNTGKTLYFTDLVVDPS